MHEHFYKIASQLQGAHAPLPTDANNNTDASTAIVVAVTALEMRTPHIN